MEQFVERLRVEQNSATYCKFFEKRVRRTDHVKRANDERLSKDDTLCAQMKMRRG
jgi:hypothetical protein